MQVISNNSESNCLYNQPIPSATPDNSADFQQEQTKPLAKADNLQGSFLHRGINMAQEIRKYECYLILNALRLTGGNQRQAARLLKIKPTTLNSKIKRYKIEV